MTSAEVADRHDLPRCGAKKRQGEGSCTQPAGWGTDHPGTGRCKLHGGSTRTQTVGAERQLVEVEARRLFEKVAPEIAPVDNPLEAYALFAGRVMAWLELMGRLLDDLESPRYRGATAEQIRGEVVLYERAMDRANAVLGTYAKLNIDERLTRISEQQADILVSVLRAGLNAAGVTPQQRELAHAEIARQLRARRSGEGVPDAR
ncbi:hypothetical protein [Streptomyces mirabilis]|uniref:Uncharacterized protein n=1 Tax=Streptomyces mirabilis TaxID=68239 RepID=A0ABU3UW88_9ACTN|nr:hypothetical protein [Streptomyces mirabilis]MDU8998201.1 hypothetical protein [Streptomyces mirabilis]